MGTQLFVGGISYNTTEQGLKEAFEQAGSVVSATIVIDKMTGQSRGFGFVEMGSEEEAKNIAAVYQLKARQINDKIKSIFNGTMILVLAGVGLYLFFNKDQEK